MSDLSALCPSAMNLPSCAATRTFWASSKSGYPQDLGTIFRGVNGKLVLSRTLWDTTVSPLACSALTPFRSRLLRDPPQSGSGDSRHIEL